MIMFVLFLGWLVVSPAVHFLLRQDPLASFRWLAPVVKECARDKKLTAIFVGSISLHLIGTRTLGQVAYNSGFDVVTHTMFGYITREIIDRTNRVHPLASRFEKKLPRRIRGVATVTAFAFVFCLGHEIQELVQTVTPVLRSMVYVTAWHDQLKDMIMNTLGIGVSWWMGNRGRPGSEEAYALAKDYAPVSER